MTGARIGIVGLGRAGLMHARNLAQDSGVSSVVLIGRDTERVMRAKLELEQMLAAGAPAEVRGYHAPKTAPASLETSTSSITELASELDGLVIATSTPSHPQLTLEAARAGLVTLVEKPITLNIDELEALVDELDEIGTPVMVAYHRRYDPAYQALQARVAAGDIGTLRVISATNHDHLPLSLDYIPTSGGSWRDLLIHDFDAITWVAGEEVVSVQAAGAVLDEPRYADSGDTDTCVALLQLRSGAIATVSGLRRSESGQDCRMEVIGTEGAFAAGLESRTPITSLEPDVPAPAAPYEQFIDRFEPAFRSEIHHFLRLVAGDSTANHTSPRSGIAALRIANAAEESRRTGTTIHLQPEVATQREAVTS